MNRKEISEIKKILQKDHTRIDRITGCYVNGEHEKQAVFREAFLSLKDEEMHKYSEILRKVLSGSLGKNLNTLEYTLEEEVNGDKHKSLMQLVDTELKDDDSIQAFYDKIIENYLYTGNYLILLAHGMYDVPARSTSNEEMFDASDYVYRFIVCAICPVNLSKPGLCYDAAAGSFVEHLQDWMLDMPSAGFLFPAFNDRNTDIHNLLYYAKKDSDLHMELASEVLGCSRPVSAKVQKEDFSEIVEDVFGRDCGFEVVKEIHENLNRIVEETKDNPDPAILGKNEIKNILSDIGAEREKLEIVDEAFEKEEDHYKTVLLSNLANTRKFEVKTPDIKISISADRTDMIETRIIDGRECVVIPLTDDIEVNGIKIHTQSASEDEEL